MVILIVLKTKEKAFGTGIEVLVWELSKALGKVLIGIVVEINVKLNMVKIGNLDIYDPSDLMQKIVG